MKKESACLHLSVYVSVSVSDWLGWAWLNWLDRLAVLGGWLDLSSGLKTLFIRLRRTHKLRSMGLRIEDFTRVVHTNLQIQSASHLSQPSQAQPA